MNKSFSEIINYVNLKRDFNYNFYFDEKIKQINTFFKNKNLDSCVIGISGGIDSTITLRLLCEAAIRPNSPIKKIVALLLPIYDFTSNQERASYFGELAVNDVINKTKISKDILIQDTIDLTFTTDTIINKSQTNYLTTNWANGQLSSIVRTPVLYYHCSLLQTIGYKSIVIGTINKSEYMLGFYGKASDAMVDMICIRDIYKTEVYKLAKFLNITEDIIERIPTGDCYDGKSDDEMIGSPYWFIDLYLLLKEYPNENFNIGSIVNYENDNVYNTTSEERVKFAINIEKQIFKNIHKFQVGKPYHDLQLEKLNRKNTFFNKLINTLK